MGRMALTKEQRRTEEAKKRKADRIVQADNLKRQKAAEEQVRKQEVKARRDALVEPEWHFMQSCVEAGRFDEADARVIPTQVLFQEYLQYCASREIATVGKSLEGLIKSWKRHLSFVSKLERVPDAEGLKRRRRCTVLPSPGVIKQDMLMNHKWTL